jgi:hypothetical protein
MELVSAAGCLIGVGGMAEDAPGLTLPRIEIRGAERRDVRSGWRFQIHVFTEEGGQYLTWAGHSYEAAILSAEGLATQTGPKVPVVDLVGA